MQILTKTPRTPTTINRSLGYRKDVIVLKMLVLETTNIHVYELTDNNGIVPQTIITF